jgi:hypothetical protein
MRVTSARIFSQEVNSVREKQSHDGDDAGGDEEFPISHRRQQRKKAKAEL